MRTTAQRRSFVTIAEAADYARVHPRTVRRWIASGQVIAYRAGPRLLRVDLADLDKMLSPVLGGRGRGA